VNEFQHVDLKAWTVSNGTGNINYEY